MLKRLILLLFALLLLSSCQAQQAALPTPSSTPVPGSTALPNLLTSTITPALTPTSTSTPSPTPLPPPKNAVYTIQARFSYAFRTVAVTEDIRYTNNSSDTLSELLLMIEPNETPGAFRLLDILWMDGQNARGFAIQNNQLRLPLTQALAPYQTLQFQIKYELKLPPIPAPSDDLRPVPFGYTERQTNLVDWYPFVAPYRSGKGWLAHKPWFYGEHQVYDMADFVVQIDVTDAPAGLILAASAPVVESGSKYSYTQKNARNIVISASPYYNVFTQKVGDVTVISYAFTFDGTAGKAALQYTAEALELFNKILTPYPHTTMTVVEADFLDGMEYDGLYFLSRGFYNLYGGTPQGYLAAIAAHETAHQWWYALVADDQALEPWLDESLCTYSEYIFYKNLHPDYLKWWWDFRVDYYEPNGLINLQLYDYAGYRPYRDAVYLNGAHFLDDLRQSIGDDAFMAFLKDYTVTNTGKLATSTDFFAILKKHTPKDLTSLVDKYFKK